MPAAPPSDYFEILGLKESLRLDGKDLQARFFNYSRQYHPDRFARGSDEQKAFALEATATLNDAFRALRDPVTRAEYVLKTHGLEIGEQRTKDVPPELLEEVFELNMALEELKTGDQDARKPVTESLAKFSHMQGGIDAELETHFANYDGGDKTALQSIRGALNRRRYISNLIREANGYLAAD